MRAPNLAWFAALLLAAAGFCAIAEARTLRWARSIDATSLDPHAADTGPNLLLAHQIYEPLILRRSDGKSAATTCSRANGGSLPSSA